jgi:hypothetical protein
MPGTGALTDQLEAASGLPAVLAAGWDAFDFIVQAATGYDDPGNGSRGFAFMLAGTAACRGRNALACAPSLPDDDSSPEPDIQVLGDETQAAASLGALAAVIERRLADARSATLGHDDDRACQAAIAAATETYALLTGDEQLWVGRISETSWRLPTVS